MWLDSIGNRRLLPARGLSSELAGDRDGPRPDLIPVSEVTLRRLDRLDDLAFAEPQGVPGERAVEEPMVSRSEHLAELRELLRLLLGVDDVRTEWTAAEQP